MSDTTNTATLDQPMTLEERDDALRQAIEQDDDEAFAELMGEPGELADPALTPATTVNPKRLSRAEKAEAEAAKEAERAALQARVPWELLPEDRAYNQKGKIDQWADDWGAFPRRYRAYTREEWTQAIDLLAQTVTDLAGIAPDYQRATGLYVEEHSADLLLLRAKKWQLLIQVPAKSSVKGKTVELKATTYIWSGDDLVADAFAELLALYVPDAEREGLLDICCQYLRSVRIRVNRVIWGQQNPDLAYLLDQGR